MRIATSWPWQGLDDSTPSRFGRFDLNAEFQPIVSPSHNRVVGYEALARPVLDGEGVSPKLLFDEIADLDSVPELDLALWQTFLRRYARTKPHAWLFLNLSAASVSARIPSAARLAQLVRNAGLSCSRIVLEIVEEAVADQAALEEFVSECRLEGFRTAIDDFGAGDAHFERIWRIRPDIVKMDRAMVAAAAHNARASQLMLSLIRMIRENGSLVLIEGIETEAEARLAWESDADLYQGFWFSYPGRDFDEAAETAQRALVEGHERFAACSDQQERELKAYLSDLKAAVLWACGQLALGYSVADSVSMLFGQAGVKRCYLLDEYGVQHGDTAQAPSASRLDTIPFNPLIKSCGATWSHRDYFRNAVDRPGDVCLSRPYVALPDTVRTVTASCLVRTADGVQVLCVDLHPELAFPGSHKLLPTHI